MTQVKIRLIGKTRLAVEEVLSHLQATASVQGQKWSHHEVLNEWRLDATLALPASSYSYGFNSRGGCSQAVSTDG
jgi:hypothetical protein